jgi:hypothetical protein
LRPSRREETMHPSPTEYRAQSCANGMLRWRNTTGVYDIVLCFPLTCPTRRSTSCCSLAYSSTPCRRNCKLDQHDFPDPFRMVCDKPVKGEQFLWIAFNVEGTSIEASQSTSWFESRGINQIWLSVLPIIGYISLGGLSIGTLCALRPVLSISAIFHFAATSIANTLVVFWKSGY